MGELCRQRRHRYVLNVVDQLPGTSRYAEAVADDEDAAAAFLAIRGDEEIKPVRRVSEWTPELRQLVTLTERINTLIQATVARRGGRTPRFPPELRPVVAADRVSSRFRKQRHQALVARVLQPDQ